MWMPFYNFILLCTEGVQGANAYGPDPKGQEHDAHRVSEKVPQIKVAS